MNKTNTLNKQKCDMCNNFITQQYYSEHVLKHVKDIDMLMDNINQIQSPALKLAIMKNMFNFTTKILKDMLR
jgi:hypothetical protein